MVEQVAVTGSTRTVMTVAVTRGAEELVLTVEVVIMVVV